MIGIFKFWGSIFPRMRLSEAYVTHFVKNSIELHDELDKLFNKADLQLIDGKLN